MLYFNDLLKNEDVSHSGVLVVRHRAVEPQLHKVLPRLAESKPKLFNAFQQTQLPRVEKQFKRAKYIAAFIGASPGTALFAGLYKMKGFKPITPSEWRRMPANIELQKSYGMGDIGSEIKSVILFDLVLIPNFYPSWRGRLVIQWHGGERSWSRWADGDGGKFEIAAIRETNPFEELVPDWQDMIFTWAELSLLSPAYQAAIKEWKGIYFIWDASDGRGYVGAAYGEENILGRWHHYAKSGHGGNKKLRKRTPASFHFSILQRVSPDTPPDEVIRLEQRWKARLHTVGPLGLNEK